MRAFVADDGDFGAEGGEFRRGRCEFGGEVDEDLIEVPDGFAHEVEHADSSAVGEGEGGVRADDYNTRAVGGGLRGEEGVFAGAEGEDE